MTVQPAQPADMEAILRMAADFHAATCYAGIIPLDLATLEDTIAGLAQNPNGVVLVAKDNTGQAVGMAAAIANPHWFNASHKVGQEMFWWVDAAARGSRAGFALIAGLEDWAKAVHCRSISMASTANLTPDVLGRVYLRRGYVPQDMFYSKVIHHA